ncbi:MAG: trigger factor [Malacoplasma sp.]|nr:trigger factor [Malacoplasma sp.]
MKILDVKKEKKFLVFNVEADEQTWRKEQEKSARKLAENVKINGYRKGKVPFEEAKKYISQMDIFDKSINGILQKTAKELVESKDFQKYEEEIFDMPPKVEVSKYTASEIAFKFSYFLFPEVSIKGYKDIKIETKKEKITDKELEVEIESQLSQNEMMVPKDGPIEKGDVAIFDFKGFIDGKPFEGGEAKNYELKIGSNQFIPGFEDQMIGMKTGDSKDVNVVFPKDYHEKKYAGKPAKFEVKVNVVNKVDKPKLDDDFVKTLNIDKITNVNEYKKHLTKNLEEKKESTYENKVREEILNKIKGVVKLSEKLADEIIDSETNKLKKQTEQQIKMYGLTMNKYFEMFGLKEEEFNKKQRETAESNILTMMGILEIAELEKIEASEKDIEEEIEKLAKLYNIKKEEIIARFGGNTNIIESLIVENKVISFFKNKK